MHNTLNPINWRQIERRFDRSYALSLTLVLVISYLASAPRYVHPLLWAAGIIFILARDLLIITIGFQAPTLVGTVKIVVQERTRAVMAFVLHRGGVSDVDMTRQNFQTLNFVGSHVTQNHTHPDSATDRNAATWFGDYFATVCGRNAFHYQAGARPIRAGSAFSRFYCWIKDLTLPYSGDAPRPHDVKVITDVDYYLTTSELERNLTEPNITLLYTMTPTVAASDTGETAFTFLPSGEIKSTVAGGAVYQHYLHDYNREHILAMTIFPPRYTAYIVERRQMNDHHSLVCLIPIASGRGIMATALVCLLGHTRLTRFNPVRDGWIRFNVRKKDGLYVTMARAGTYAAATVTVEQDAMVSESLRATSQLVLSDVKRLCNLHQEALVVRNYHLERAQDNGLTVISSPDEHSTVKYQIGKPEEYDSDARPVVEPFMNPIVKGGCYNPMLGPSTVTNSIQARVTDCFVDRPMTEFIFTTMKEFVDFVKPDQLLHPVDPKEVYENQSSPSQQRILDRGFNQAPEDRENIAAFIKAESLAGLKYPRNISTLPPRVKALYSCFTYALAKHVKTLDSYAFSKTPRLVAERMVEMARAAHSMCEFDITRMDGHVSRLMRTFEKMILGASFSERYHAELFALHEAQYKNTGYVSYGRFKESVVKYFQEYSRASGSPETSLLNTLITMYMHYLALRLMHNGSYMSPMEAWASLGLYGGDDGITPNLDSERLERAGKLLGFKVKAELIPRGSSISFLNRHYPNAWLGDPSSFSTIKRALVKFHVTPRLTVTREEKLIERCLGYYFSDRLTPVIGDIAERVVQIIHPDGTSVQASTVNPLKLRSYHSVCPITEQYPQAPLEARQEYLNKQLPDFPYQKFLEWLNTCQTLQDILDTPTWYNLEVDKLKGFVIPNDIGDKPPVKVAKQAAPKHQGKKPSAPGQSKRTPASVKKTPTGSR